MPDDDLTTEPPVAVDYYTVLNVGRGASQTEINERYRALSLLFHPDKQRDPRTVEAATDEFLKLQKAYEVLSDPFLKEVYDALGERGLSIRWPPAFSSLARDHLRKELQEISKAGFNDADIDRETPLANVTVIDIDGSPLFYKPGGKPTVHMMRRGRPPKTLRDRLSTTQIFRESISHNFVKRISPSTLAIFGTTVEIQNRALGKVTYVGTVRHQFSPRFAAKAVAIYGGTFITYLTAAYKDGDNMVDFRCGAAPFVWALPPSGSITYSRRLFHKKPQHAEISLSFQQVPTLSLKYNMNPPLSEDLIDATFNGIPSTSGLKFFAWERSLGVEFRQVIPSFVGSVAVTILELALELRASLECGFQGFGASLGGKWTSKFGDEVGVTTMLGTAGVLMRLDFTMWKQQLTLPIHLAMEHDPVASACSVVIPSTLAVLGYCFIIRPRRRAHRIAKIRAARQVLQEDSTKRKHNTVVDLLKDTARKVMSSETAKGGLVIQDAYYGVIDTQEGARDLAIDVTIPVQALVRSSQLHISSEGSKANLQGFSDPAPSTAKCLRIHYLFRGRPHFAEVPDYLPVVLPLAEHEIEKC